MGVYEINVPNVYSIMQANALYAYCGNSPVMYIDHSGKIPTPEEALDMVEYTYKMYNEEEVDELSGEWEYIGSLADGDTMIMGFFKRMKDSGEYEYTIANKGTNIDNLTEWCNNFAQPFGASNDMKASIENAQMFVDANPDAEVTFVGHSKGGAEAAANAVATNKNAILFNPATVNLQAYDLDSSTYSAEMTAYIVEGDILNLLFAPISSPIDNVIYLPQQYEFSYKMNIWSAYNNIKNNIKNSIKNHDTPAIRQALKEWRDKQK